MKLKKNISKNFLKYLCISREKEFSKILTKASSCNTYIETISNVADSLHWNVNKNYTETLTTEFFRFIKPLIRKARIGSCDLVADITEENFYGSTSNLHIHGWTGKDGVKGKFRFLTVGILFRNQIFPFYTAILPVGYFKAEHLGKAVDLCYTLGIRPRKILLDRGFYSGDVIDTLSLKNINYLIFVPKNKLFKYMLESVRNDVVVEHKIKYSKGKSKYKADTNITLIKNFLDYDWVFASNIFLQDARKYIFLYKKRWNIETMFRVHDEARIKSKSINPVIRLFYFLLGMLFVLIWNLYFKTKITFKLFVINIYEELFKETLSNTSS